MPWKRSCANLLLNSVTTNFAVFSDAATIECGLATVQDITPMMELHSHFSDDKWQNATTTYLHMDTMLELLKK